MHLNLEALGESFDLVAPRGDELMDVFGGRRSTSRHGQMHSRSLPER
jgi:hypothetical protein